MAAAAAARKRSSDGGPIAHEITASAAAAAAKDMSFNSGASSSGIAAMAAAAASAKTTSVKSGAPSLGIAAMAAAAASTKRLSSHGATPSLGIAAMAAAAAATKKRSPLPVSGIAVMAAAAAAAKIGPNGFDVPISVIGTINNAVAISNGGDSDFPAITAAAVASQADDLSDEPPSAAGIAAIARDVAAAKSEPNEGASGFAAQPAAVKIKQPVEDSLPATGIAAMAAAAAAARTKQSFEDRAPAPGKAAVVYEKSTFEGGVPGFGNPVLTDATSVAWNSGATTEIIDTTGVSSASSATSVAAAMSAAAPSTSTYDEKLGDSCLYPATNAGIIVGMATAADNLKISPDGLGKEGAAEITADLAVGSRGVVLLTFLGSGVSDGIGAGNGLAEVQVDAAAKCYGVDDLQLSEYPPTGVEHAAKGAVAVLEGTQTSPTKDVDCVANVRLNSDELFATQASVGSGNGGNEGFTARNSKDAVVRCDGQEGADTKASVLYALPKRAVDRQAEWSAAVIAATADFRISQLGESDAVFDDSSTASDDFWVGGQPEQKKDRQADWLAAIASSVQKFEA